MRLTTLDPKLSDGGWLRFDCPVCVKNHGIRVPLGPGSQWSATGEFPETLTVSPSIDVGCWHGHIVEGEVTTV